MKIMNSTAIVFSKCMFNQKLSIRRKTGFFLLKVNPLIANPTKWSNTLKQFVGNLPMNCLSVFDPFCGVGASRVNIILT